jgi:hypothetical protein
VGDGRTLFELELPEVVEGPVAANGVESIAAEEPEVAVFAGPADGGFARAGDVGGGGDAECAVDAVLAIADADPCEVFALHWTVLLPLIQAHCFVLGGEAPEIVEWVDDSVSVVAAAEEPEVASAVDGADGPASAAGEHLLQRTGRGCRRRWTAHTRRRADSSWRSQLCCFR